MDSASIPPNPPLRAELVERSDRPIRVLLEHPRPSWLGRIVRWGLVVLLVLLVIGWLAPSDDRDNLREKWHSLSKTSSNKIAVISVEGTIFGNADFVRQQIDRVRDDDKVKAVVVRVDSPGGTVTGSDYIYHHLKKLAEDRDLPLVVSMGSIAASGGYYVAMAAGDTKDVIYAEPTTWTGSIGVIIPHYNVADLLAEIKVQDDSIASNPLKMMGSPTRKFPEPIREEEQAILKGLVDASFDGFKEIVLSGRPALREDQAMQDVVFTGRIFTAKQARDHKLVDRIGFIEEAIDRAIELAALDKDDVRVVKFEQQRGLLDQMLFGPQGRQSWLDLRGLIELNVPKAYYLCTWFPALDIAAQ
jgi:protease-4